MTGRRDSNQSKYEKFSRYAGEGRDESPFRKKPRLLRWVLPAFAAALLMGIIAFSLIFPDKAAEVKNRLSESFPLAANLFGGHSSDNHLPGLSGNETEGESSAGSIFQDSGPGQIAGSSADAMPVVHESEADKGPTFTK